MIVTRMVYQTNVTLIVTDTTDFVTSSPIVVPIRMSRYQLVKEKVRPVNHQEAVRGNAVLLTKAAKVIRVAADDGKGMLLLILLAVFPTSRRTLKRSSERFSNVVSTTHNHRV